MSTQSALPGDSVTDPLQEDPLGLPQAVLAVGRTTKVHGKHIAD